MNQIFNEMNYRNYLENTSVLPIDVDSIEREERIDKYSNAYLQKLIDDTQKFAMYVLEELKKDKNDLEDSAYIKIQLNDEDEIKSTILGVLLIDKLYNVEGFGEDFWISKHLLEEFLNTKIYINAEYKDDESDNITAVPYILITMSKDQLKNMKI
ncbi:MAG: hypothetical protein IKE63_00670 [Bacilli bacterium]|nr:hypothetical protein [Bacilli bacterium]